MGNGYKHHHHHHSQNFHHTTTTTFLPLLCRSASIQEIKVLPQFSYDDDPSSPRVTCIGHVKRTNKVIGFPTPTSKFTTTTATATTPSVRGPARGPILNPTYSSIRSGPGLRPRFDKSNSGSLTPLTAITTATTTTTTTPSVSGSTRIPILNSNYSIFRVGPVYTTTSDKSMPGSRTPIAATTATPGSRESAHGLVLNSNYSTLRAGPGHKRTFDKSKLSSWIPLYTTTIAAATTTAIKSNPKHTNQKRLFSSKNLIEPINSTSCRRSREMKMVNCRSRGIKADFSGRNYDVDLDPPLPVVKKVKEPGFDREEVNLWKRRSNGFQLKSLQIQPIHLGNNNLCHSPTTV